MRIAANTSSAALYSVTLCLAFLTPVRAHTQTLPHFPHVVIIFQENRTPDNLFGSGSPGQVCTHQDDFEPGVDIVNGGLNKNVSGGITCFTAHPLGLDPQNPATAASTAAADATIGSRNRLPSSSSGMTGEAGTTT